MLHQLWYVWEWSSNSTVKIERQEMDALTTGKKIIMNKEKLKNAINEKKKIDLSFMRILFSE